MIHRAAPLDLIACPSHPAAVAEVLPKARPDDLTRIRCSTGHDLSLSPDLERTCRRIAKLAQERGRS